MARIDGRRDSRNHETAFVGRMRHWVGRTLNLAFRLIDRMFRFPDTKAGWFVPLFAKMWKLLGHERFDIVLSSSPPHSLHLPLVCLRNFKYFKWVTDFRDPWTVPRRAKGAGLGLRVCRAMEKWVISRCDFVIANTQGNQEALIREFGDTLEGRITIITNGLDLELDSVAVDGDKQALDCDIVYMGEVYDGMLDIYRNAVRLIRDRGQDRIPRLWVYGGPPSFVTLRAVEDDGLGEWIVFKGRVSYNRSRQIIKDAPALLLLLPHRRGHETWVPSKVYSYIFSAAPILALVPRGDASRIVEETGRGVVISAEEPEEVASAIVNFLAPIQTGAVRNRRNEREFRRYRMDVVMAQLDGVLRHTAGR